jgi:hypothetical protein
MKKGSMEHQITINHRQLIKPEDESKFIHWWFMFLNNSKNPS